MIYQPIPCNTAFIYFSSPRFQPNHSASSCPSLDLPSSLPNPYIFNQTKVRLESNPYLSIPIPLDPIDISFLLFCPNFTTQFR
ncbi:hypothetical protein L1887_03186 [Cichorium endivia]|nr:hypothetical protein L1887_03186 [Cichorium endivia]